jgi:hypothetical protein
VRCSISCHFVILDALRLQNALSVILSPLPSGAITTPELLLFCDFGQKVNSSIGTAHYMTMTLAAAKKSVNTQMHLQRAEAAAYKEATDAAARKVVVWVGYG